MGLYINPPSGSKEGWLMGNAELVKGMLVSAELPLPEDPELALVCHVDNGWMTAAAVCLDESERQAFLQPGDNRPKAWLYVKREALRTLPGLEGV